MMRLVAHRPIESIVSKVIEAGDFEIESLMQINRGNDGSRQPTADPPFQTTLKNVWLKQNATLGGT